MKIPFLVRGEQRTRAAPFHACVLLHAPLHFTCAWLESIGVSAVWQSHWSNHTNHFLQTQTPEYFEPPQPQHIQTDLRNGRNNTSVLRLDSECCHEQLGWQRSCSASVRCFGPWPRRLLQEPGRSSRAAWEPSGRTLVDQRQGEAEKETHPYIVAHAGMWSAHAEPPQVITKLWAPRTSRTSSSPH